MLIETNRWIEIEQNRWGGKKEKERVITGERVKGRQRYGNTERVINREKQMAVRNTERVQRKTERKKGRIKGWWRDG